MLLPQNKFLQEIAKLKLDHEMSVDAERNRIKEIEVYIIKNVFLYLNLFVNQILEKHITRQQICLRKY